MRTALENGYHLPDRRTFLLVSCGVLGVIGALSTRLSGEMEDVISAPSGPKKPFGIRIANTSAEVCTWEAFCTKKMQHDGSLNNKKFHSFLRRTTDGRWHVANKVDVDPVGETDMAPQNLERSDEKKLSVWIRTYCADHPIIFEHLRTELSLQKEKKIMLDVLEPKEAIALSILLANMRLEYGTNEDAIKADPIGAHELLEKNHPVHCRQIVEVVQAIFGTLKTMQRKGDVLHNTYLMRMSSKHTDIHSRASIKRLSTSLGFSGIVSHRWIVACSVTGPASVEITILDPTESDSEGIQDYSERFPFWMRELSFHELLTEKEFMEQCIEWLENPTNKNSHLYPIVREEVEEYLKK